MKTLKKSTQIILAHQKEIDELTKQAIRLKNSTVKRACIKESIQLFDKALINEIGQETKKMKTIYRVNTGHLVGFGYQVNESYFKVKTIFGVDLYKKTDLIFFPECKKINLVPNF